MIKLIKSSFYHETETKHALTQFILDQEIFSMNEQCKEFERAFALKQGREFAVYVGNGSVANLLLIQSLLNSGKLNRGDRVGFSALTWPTNVMPLIQLGLEPVAIDCRLETLNVSPGLIEKEIHRLKAFFITNVLGFCDDLPQIRELCTKNNVLLIEDNCESLGSKIGDTLLGNFGLASTFSFFVGHHLSTIEGGMVCTDDEELYQNLVMSRAHGWDRNLEPNVQADLRRSSKTEDFYAKYTFYDLASNFRPTEINGFLGNTQLPYWDEIVSRRADNFMNFQAAMTSNDDFYRYDLSHMSLISNFAMPLICKTEELARSYRTKLAEAGVEIRPIIAGNMTRQPFYEKYVKHIPVLPNSDLVHSNGFYFGNNPEMTPDEIDVLSELIVKR